jgi:hypothetical protein
LGEGAGETSADGDRDSAKAPSSVEALFGVEAKPPARDAAKAESAVPGPTPGAGPPAEEDAAPAVRVSGYYQNFSAYTFGEPGHYSAFRNTLQLAADGQSENGVRWKASGRLVYDPLYEHWSNFYPKDVRDDQGLYAWVRQTYVDLSLDDWEFRLGRQDIVWGEVVGVFVADVISARDQRYFYGTDLDQTRIPQWALRAERYAGDLHAELVLIPYQTYDKIGKPGAEFYPLQEAARIWEEGGPISFDDAEKPRGFDSMGYGIRLAYAFPGWDASLLYYSSIDRSAYFDSDWVMGPTPELVLTPKHKRIHQFGGTFSMDLGSSVLRAEAVYTTGRRFAVDQAGVTGLDTGDQLDYILSLEALFPEETTLNVQFLQTWLPQHDSDYVVDRWQTTVTGLLTTKAIDPKVEPQLYYVRAFDPEQWLLRAAVKWEFVQDWQLFGGVDLFGGSREGYIGQFSDRDRVFLELWRYF